MESFSQKENSDRNSKSDRPDWPIVLENHPLALGLAVGGAAYLPELTISGASATKGGDSGGAQPPGDAAASSAPPSTLSGSDKLGKGLLAEKPLELAAKGGDGFRPLDNLYKKLLGELADNIGKEAKDGLISKRAEVA